VEDVWRNMMAIGIFAGSWEAYALAHLYPNRPKTTKPEARIRRGEMTPEDEARRNFREYISHYGPGAGEQVTIPPGSTDDIPELHGVSGRILNPFCLPWKTLADRLGLADRLAFLLETPDGRTLVNPHWIAPGERG